MVIFNQSMNTILYQTPKIVNTEVIGLLTWNVLELVKGKPKGTNPATIIPRGFFSCLFLHTYMILIILVRPWPSRIKTS